MPADTLGTLGDGKLDHFSFCCNDQGAKASTVTVIVTSIAAYNTLPIWLLHPFKLTKFTIAGSMLSICFAYFDSLADPANKECYLNPMFVGYKSCKCKWSTTHKGLINVQVYWTLNIEINFSKLYWSNICSYQFKLRENRLWTKHNFLAGTFRREHFGGNILAGTF